MSLCFQCGKLITAPTCEEKNYHGMIVRVHDRCSDKFDEDNPVNPVKDQEDGLVNPTIESDNILIKDGW